MIRLVTSNISWGAIAVLIAFGLWLGVGSAAVFTLGYLFGVVEGVWNHGDRDDEESGHSSG